MFPGINQEVINSSYLPHNFSGVMHNGSKPYEGVIETIRNLKNEDVRMVILSNSSKRQSHSIKMLKKLGNEVHIIFKFEFFILKLPCSHL